MGKKLDEALKEKNEKKIYKLFGKSIYLKIQESKSKKQDIKKLLSEGRFLEMYEKYGERKYKEYLNGIMKADVKNELGIKPGIFNAGFFDRMKRSGKKVALLVGIYVSILPPLFIGSATYDKKVYDEMYSEILSEYNRDIEEYAKYINSLDLTDLEIVVKVMNDMWANIDGYKTPNPEYDTLGYNRLSLYYDGYGVCRNMADDFSARMNAINPDYDAFNLHVYFDKGWTINNIETRNLEASIAPQQPLEDVELETSDDFDFTKLVGNHMVSCITLKEEGIILVVDPTNPSIGVLKNGKIVMLSNLKNALDIKSLSSLFLDIDWNLTYQEKMSESFKNNDNFDEMYEKYGIEAQNEVLDDIIEKYDESQYKIRGR